MVKAVACMRRGEAGGPCKEVGERPGELGVPRKERQGEVRETGLRRERRGAAGVTMYGELSVKP